MTCWAGACWWPRARKWACGNGCFNGMTRTVWDGDQVLHELRAPMAAAERDTGQVPIGTQSAPLYGQVAYMFGAQLDRPLLVYRMNYDTLFPGVHRIVPHSNWGGSFDTGTIDGLRDKDAPCLSFPMVPEDEQQYPDTYMGGIDRGPGRDSVKLCMAVDWPAAYLWRNHLSRQNSAYGARSWMGSLIQNKRDETGQLYMRHRFYDPQTGRFTQEDPIGLAGGLNAYGFANGDPVSYSDPYGLVASSCETHPWLCATIESASVLVGGLIGFVGGGGAGALASIPTGGTASPVLVPAGAWKGALVGGAAGYVAGPIITGALFSEDASAGSRRRGGSSNGGEPQRQSSIRSLERNIEEHQSKLDAYRKNPDAFDNQGLLQNAPSDAVRERIIAGRIRHLEGEIRTFQTQLSRLQTP